VFVIAEAGSNWRAGSAVRDLKRAFALVDAAAEAGADAVKFQTYRADTVYVSNAGVSGYLSKSGISKPITELFKNLEMPYEMVPKLAARCRKRRIAFMTTPFSEADFRAVDPYVRVHKIASYEITHPALLRLAARSRKPTILSTGASTLDDIDWAVAEFRRHGGKNLSLMQCTAKYPAPFEALNLSAIPTLLTRYRVPVGLSDHSLDPLVAPAVAVALGATLIEKHFTLDRSLPGPDHAFAVTCRELSILVHAVHAASSALGTGKKEVLPEEKELHAYAQRAVQAIRTIRRGDTLREGDNVAVLRPGSRTKGMHPRFLSRAEGKRAKRAIALGDGLKAGDF